MNMPISNISSGLSYSPALELPETRVKAEKPRIDTDVLTALVPGNDRPDAPPPPDIRQVAIDIAQVSQAFNKKLQFVVDQQSHEVIVKVIDKRTDKVIKVLPPEELQRLHRKLREAIGYLFNEEV
jgi:flagellar protein FlaG